MAKIKSLSADLVPKISAGEVIERPASIVKELVENALDAGAANIVVEFTIGGLDKIRVIDDGEGMSAEDLTLSVLPHTTSKISTIEDLSLIKTMGFRGEALASMCAVADVSLRSCERGQHKGFEITVNEGQVSELKAIGMSGGTVVEVTNLFAYLPARKKFLKNPTNEAQLIINVVTAFALAHIQTGFELYRDGKRMINIKTTDDLHLRTEKLFGADFAHNLVPINFFDDHLKISGLISKPVAAQPNRYNQYLFVNKRIVDDLHISKTIKDAYKTLLDARSYPPYILTIELDYGLVDVNVHPQKDQVRFWNEPAVKNAVHTAVSQSLQQYDLTVGSKAYEIDRKAADHLMYKLKDIAPVWNVRVDYTPENYDQAIQIDATYIAYPFKKDLILVDQHAAHESILYKELLQSFEQNKLAGEFARLENPVYVDIPPNYLPVIEENLDYFGQFGFEVEFFGNSQLKVTSIPAIYKDHDLAKLVNEIVYELAEEKPYVDIDEKSRQTIAFLACRSAIKAGDILNKDEMERLLSKLSENPDLYTCPHGRPLRIVVSNADLAKMFKRI
jgi:DNA mismatch repair protein MutL